MDAKRDDPRAGVRLTAWLAVLALACLALFQLSRARTPGRGPGSDAVRRAPEEARAPSLLGLEGDAAARRAARETAGAAGPVAEAEVVAVTRLAQPRDEDALAPGAVEDLVRDAAAAPLRVPRSDLVGDVGPYGLGDRASAFAPGWVGTVFVERPPPTPTQATEDTEKPVSTAVVGQVVREDGTPVPCAEVILFSSFYLRQVFYDRHVREIGRTFTDSEGRFDLRPIDLDTVHFGRSGEVLVTVRHPHLPDVVAQPLKGLAPGQATDVGALTLPDRCLIVSGTILNLAGEPIEGAVVRASGLMNPVDYDKTERMIVLSSCPSAVTDAHGRYRLVDVAPGRHEISVHVNVDCVMHHADTWQGERDFSPRVRAGHAVKGRVLDAEGRPVAAAVVRGGGNWTPTYADGTFWLDNVDPGPLVLDVSHHDFARQLYLGVKTDLEEPIDLVLTRRLARVTLEVADPLGSPVDLVEIAWTWAPGRGPDEFTPRSPRWHDPGGVFALVIPDGVVGASITREGVGGGTLAEVDLSDGKVVRVALVPPPATEACDEPAR